MAHFEFLGEPHLESRLIWPHGTSNCKLLIRNEWLHHTKLKHYRLIPVIDGRRVRAPFYRTPIRDFSFMRTAAVRRYLLPCFVVLFALTCIVFQYDPATVVADDAFATVIAAYPKNRFSGWHVRIQIRMATGETLFATAIADQHYPYRVGDRVRVVTYQTFLTHQRRYEAIYAPSP